MYNEKYKEEMAHEVNTFRVDEGDEEFLTGEEVSDMYHYDQSLYTKKSKKDEIKELNEKKNYLNNLTHEVNTFRVDEGDEEFLTEEEVENMYNSQGMKR